MRNLLADIPLWKRPVPFVSIHCDCQAAIDRAMNQTFNEKNRQLFNDGVISLEFVRLEMNLADPLTKPLSEKQVEIT